MPFSYRNARYLRISEHTVLPLYIYLDERHINWMTDYILQCVLEDLRPNIGPKLRIENGLSRTTGPKKGSVNVHKGDTYQFAYWFRKIEPHAVLAKNCHFVQVTRTEGSFTEQEQEASLPSKEGGKKSLEAIQQVPRRSVRKRKAASYCEYGDADNGGDDDAYPNELNSPSLSVFPSQEDMNEIEEKPKMTMQLTYQGFTICDRCLCVIIQPWPLPSTMDRSSIGPRNVGSLSVCPPGVSDHVPTSLRERTPLFLPDFDDLRRSVTPLPSRSVTYQSPPHDETEQEQAEEEEDIMAFSQAMTSFPDERAGSADEDEDAGGVFFGDADERKGM